MFVAAHWLNREEKFPTLETSQVETSSDVNDDAAKKHANISVTEDVFHPDRSSDVTLDDRKVSLRLVTPTVVTPVKVIVVAAVFSNIVDKLPLKAAPLMSMEEKLLPLNMPIVEGLLVHEKWEMSIGLVLPVKANIVW